MSDDWRMPEQKIPLFKDDEYHFHLCQACLYIWGHKASDLEDRTKGHRCPKCDCGPYFLGYTTRHDVQCEKRLLKAVRE